ncbi:hypothetical protein [Pleurocapsa sp. PCC 7319]|uniref:hypothetical protein n=1 Tax=Pleurocapsa sp. PCC 7319 TaxID=118161 RepID=UPI00034C13B1|nr:hypothetical protein [Pleurocapsa sp. PCC 7319]
MNYQPYFSLQLFHDYYQQQTCADLTIEPTNDCQRILHNHRLVSKPKRNGWQLFVPLQTDRQPVIPLDSSAIFTFLLKLNNPHFLSITDLDPEYQPNSLYVFSDEAANATTDSFSLTSTLLQREELALEPSKQSPLAKSI